MKYRVSGDMSDLIDRQAAIDEIKALYEWHDTVTEDRTIDHLKRLPSTKQPRTCEFWDDESNFCALHRPSAQRKVLKYTGESICLHCQTVNCDGCMYEPMKGVQ